MLIADPSSTCDVCFENFSSHRECWSIPCGHIFCRECLSRLTQYTCPVCRASMGINSFDVHPIRKVHVDFSKCKNQPSDGPESHSRRQLRKLEQRIVSETLEGHGLTVQRAANLSEQVSELLKSQTPNEFGLLRSIGVLLSKLSASMAHVYEGTSLSQAVKASYEHRIQQLEQSLKEQTRLLNRSDRGPRAEPERSSSAHQPTRTPHTHKHRMHPPN